MSLRDCFITDESGNTSKAKRQIGATKLLTSAEYLAVFFSRFNSLFNYWKVFLIHINFSNIHQGWLEPEKTLYNMNPCDQRSLQNIKCMKTQVKHWLSFLFRLSCDLHRFVLNMLTRQFFCLKFNRKVFSFKTNRKPVSLEKKKMKKTWGGVFFCSPAWPNYFHLKTDSML